MECGLFDGVGGGGSKGGVVNVVDNWVGVYVVD